MLTFTIGGTDLEAEYAEVRKGEFLAAQYQRALALEAEALQLAAAQRYGAAPAAMTLNPSPSPNHHHCPQPYPSLVAAARPGLFQESCLMSRACAAP